MNLFDLAAKLSLDDKEFNKKADDADQKGQKLKKTLGTGLKVAAGAAAAGMAALAAGAMAVARSFAKNIKETAEYGDNVDKMSQKLGLSAEAYQEWDYIIGQAGADIDSMTTGLKTLTNKLDDAKNGGADAQKMFAKLGLSMEDLSTMSREEVFEATIAGFQSMADTTERAALANDLFGKSGQNLTPLFNSTIEDTQALKDAAHELGFVMSDENVKASADFQDALDTMSKSFDGLKRRMVQDFMPGITSVMEGLAKIFGGDTEGGLGQINQGVEEFSNKLKELLPTMIEIGGNIVLSIAQAIVDNLPTIVESALSVLNAITQGIVDNKEVLVDAAVNIVMMLVNNILENTPILFDAALSIIEALISGIGDALPELIPAAIDCIMTLVTTLIEHLPDLIMSGGDLIGGLITGILNAIPVLIKALPEVIKGIITGIINGLPQIFMQAGEIIISIIDALIAGIPDLIMALPEIIMAIIDAFANTDWGKVGSDLLEGIKNGFLKKVSSLWQTVKDACRRLLDSVKNFLGIHSPSKVFADQVGKMIPEGIGEGIEDNTDDMIQAAHDSIDELTGSISVGDGVGNMSFGAVNITVNGAQYSNPTELAEAIGIELQKLSNRRSAVYA